LGGSDAVERRIEPHEVDVQAAQVLSGLRELEQLLEEPETEEALDLAKNARTTEQYNILRRLRKSLTQYLEREGDLFYVGLVGHFSSGKSSTINSILDIWETDHERATDLNPTDTTITLITSDENARSLLGVIREGHVTIRHESVNNGLLDKVVVADTPGSGDTQFVEEVARDFLPICDVILFFFSATSPLDKTDLPLLTEIHIRLSGTMAEERRQYESNILAARRRRLWLYATMVVGATLLAFTGYVLYAFVNRSIPQDIVNAIIWNLVATVISGSAGAFFAKWRDDFPDATKRILEDSQAILRDKVLGIVEEEFRGHEFSALDEALLSKRLLDTYNRIVSFDPDGWNQIASERLDTLRKYDADFRRLRNEYERDAEQVFAQTSSYFSDASKNLERLNGVAARVKARAIEPSFQLLANTRDSLNEVKKQIHGVEFSH